MGAAEPARSSRRQSHSPFRAASWHLKRLLETIAAGVALVLLSPVWLLVTLAVWTSSGGPVLFHQRRIGRGGRPFVLHKFRTMEVNADSDTTWSVERDRRITPVGRFLRDTSLDELPQLVNVIRGEMALVGPRPERPYFVRQFEAEVPDYAARQRVRPGITGWAQVHGLRGDSSIPDRVRFDNDYIDNWSLHRDAVIMIRTMLEMAGSLQPGALAASGRLSWSRGARLAASGNNGDSMAVSTDSAPAHNGSSRATSASDESSTLGENGGSPAPRPKGRHGDPADAPGHDGEPVTATAVPPVGHDSPSPPRTAS